MSRAELLQKIAQAMILLFQRMGDVPRRNGANVPVGWIERV
jgi:hypothetical protein